MVSYNLTRFPRTLENYGRRYGPRYDQPARNVFTDTLRSKLRTHYGHITGTCYGQQCYSHNGALRKQDLVGLVPFLSDLLSDMYMHYIVHYIALHSALQKTA